VKVEFRAITNRGARYRQESDYIFGDAISEEFLLRVTRHVLKRQHGDGRLCRERERHCVSSGSGDRIGGRADHNAIRPHRASYVLDLLRAHILERETHLVPHLLVRRGAYADPARVGQRFKAGGDIHPVAEDVAILNDDVANIDAHAEFYATPRLYRTVAGGHPALDLHRAANGIDHAGELDEKAVAGGLDDPSHMPGNLGIAYFPADRTQRGEGALLPSAANNRQHQRRGSPLAAAEPARRSSGWPP
jgi:hypothetical protein